MFNKTFLIAVLISFAIHLFWIFSVNVVVPGKTMVEKVYTQVEFLGSILGKTAFDIMLKRSDPYGLSYQNKEDFGTEQFLEINNEKQAFTIGGAVPSFDKYFDSVVCASLLADKVIPDIFLGSRNLLQNEDSEKDVISGRKVLYKPDPPIVEQGIYGTNTIFKIKLKVLISATGNVKMMEPINTTGYPELDMVAMKYFKEWIFEPLRDNYMDDGWIDVEVIINTENGKHD